MARASYYPLFPVCSAVTALFMLLVLATSLYRRSHNVALIVLIICIFLSAVCYTVSAIVWSDNVAINDALAVYCDIWTHLQIFNLISMPACILVLVRRLYLIASLYTVDPWPSRLAKRLNLALELILVFVLPAAASAVAYTFTQIDRFSIYERFGCIPIIASEGFTVLTIQSWHIIFPFISVCIYCPRIILRFYGHSKSLMKFLNNNGSVTRGTYLRLMVLACIDFICVFPIGVVNIATNIQQSLELRNGTFPFFVQPEPQHVTMQIVLGIPFENLETESSLQLVILQVGQWGAVFEGCVIFAIFGFTDEALEVYRQWFHAVRSCFTRKPPSEPEVSTTPSVRDAMSFAEEGPSISTIPLPYHVDAGGWSQGTIASPLSAASKLSPRLDTHCVGTPVSGKITFA